MNTWKELGDKFDLRLKQSVPNLNLSIQVKMSYFADAQAFLQQETKYVERKEDIVIPANGNLQIPYPLSFRVRHPLAVWDLAANQEYGIRDWRQYQAFIENFNFPPAQNNVIPPVNPLTNTDYAGFIVAFNDRQMYVYPTGTIDRVLTVNYIPSLPQLSSIDPYWTAWYASSAAFASNYATQTPEREFYDYSDALVWYAVREYCYGFDSKWAQMMVNRAEEKIEEIINSMLKQKTLVTRNVQAQYYGGGLEFYDQNQQQGYWRYPRVL